MIGVICDAVDYFERYLEDSEGPRDEETVVRRIEILADLCEG